jgi:hypothetical protein
MPVDEYCQTHQLFHPVGRFGQATPHSVAQRGKVPKAVELTLPFQKFNDV